LRAGTLGNRRPTNTVEVIQVDEAAPHRHVHEVPVRKIDAQNEVPGELPLQAQIHMECGRTRQIGRRYSCVSGNLLSDLDRLHGWICIGQALGKAGPNAGQNAYQVSAGEQGRSATKIQRLAHRNAWHACQRVQNRRSLERMLAESRRAKRRALRVELLNCALKRIIEAGPGTNYSLAVRPGRPGKSKRWGKVRPGFARRPQSASPQQRRKQRWLAQIIVRETVGAPA